MDKEEKKLSIEIAIAWCLAWGEQEQPQIEPSVLHQMREAMMEGKPIPDEVRSHVEQVQQLDELPYPQQLNELAALATTHDRLWESRIGLVYGGATKIKQYVFEASKLQDIRGASALLDRINLIDLPAFFNKPPESPRLQPQFQSAREWLSCNSSTNTDSTLIDALIPELIVYSTGGNILAFCPAAYVHRLANAIEKRYTTETLTANSCAVGETFRFLELRYGLLNANIEQTKWLEWYRQHADRDLVKTYFGKPTTDLDEQFKRRKSFNELVGKLATRFNQRRSGHDIPEHHRPSRRYPPMYETHPYLRRDGTDRRSAVCQVTDLPNSPWFSEPTARKRLIGQKAKREDISGNWFQKAGFNWNPGTVESWVQRFENFLTDNPEQRALYNPSNIALQESRSLREIGSASNGFVAYIYADGNNMGGYIQSIKTASEFQNFSEIVSLATEQSVYYALAKHLAPHKLHGIDDAETKGRNDQWVHPFEILTIGGDDVMLVVPAHQALAIAKTISEKFEDILLESDNEEGAFSVESADTPNQSASHRYRPQTAKSATCKLSMSAGVLIAADNTPIYYAENLTNQLLKSAKKKAKQLKHDNCYYGGTIDFLVMKSVTMLSSKVAEFRESGLTVDGQHKLKLYAAPFTLHEIEGLLETARALKKADFPRSQLYQIRSLLERGKHTAMLNYRYFRVRLDKKQQELLRDDFEEAWCQPKDTQNKGNLAPWMSLKEETGTVYETIWRELIDLYPFTDIDKREADNQSPSDAAREVR